jgi:two-component system cell cycle sensor histidine kinase/response regulator CckA
MSPDTRKTTDAVGWARGALPTILLVEDEAAVREVTREALEMAGYHVLEASGPEEAAGIVNDQSREIDLLLTDVVMPGMCGTELARQSRESRPELVTIFMTGYSESEILRTAIPGGSQSHIQKPFTIDGLLSRVADALGARWRGNEKYRATQFNSR